MLWLWGVISVSMGSLLLEAAGARQLQGLGVNSLIKWGLISVKQTPQLLGVNWWFYVPSNEQVVWGVVV